MASPADELALAERLVSEASSSRSCLAGVFRFGARAEDLRGSEPHVRPESSFPDDALQPTRLDIRSGSP